MKSILFVLVVRTGFISSSPVVDPNNFEVTEVKSEKGQCLLPPVIGASGRSTFIEDCDSLDQFPLFPFPDYKENKYGVHPQVCCPEKRHKTSICFPTDEWCPSFTPPDYDDVGDYPAYDDEGSDYVDDQYDDAVDDRGAAGDYDYGAAGDYADYAEPATIAEGKCEGAYQGWTCVNFKECSLVVDQNGTAVKAGVCGYDTSHNVIKICCHPSLIAAQDNSENSLVPPRYPGYDCQDKHRLCKKWRKNGACELDQDFNVNQEDPEDPQGFVSSSDMFDIMMGVCMECRCPQWARDGQCVVNPYFMVHSCRESCGVCGFLSPFNSEVQTVSGKTYSDFADSNFDCGRVELLSVLNGDDTFIEEKSEKDETNTVLEDYEDENSIDLRTDDDVFFSLDRDGNKFSGFCGATRISDRWVVTAAHCHDDFGILADDTQKKLAVQTFRDKTKYKEIVEIKRVFKHPKYTYPNLYNDIAVIELGRRIVENFPKYGETPTCLDQGREDIIGKTATVQGYGTTETGSVGTLLEANLTIISNDRCEDIIHHNVTKSDLFKGQLNKGLPKGLNNQLLCGRGEKLENGVFRGSCKGDSGGPLTVNNSDKRKTLTGIVSGGLGCGTGSPGWYTKVSFFYPWIKCVIEKSVKFKNVRKLIDEACIDETFEGDGPEEEDPIFGNIF